MKQLSFLAIALLLEACSSLPTGLATILSPAPIPSGCPAFTPAPLPTPLPAGSFTYDIASFQDPEHPITADQDAVKTGNIVNAFERDVLELNLVSSSYLSGILSRYGGSVVRQEPVVPAPGEINPQTGVATAPPPITTYCPSYLIRMSGLDSVDLGDLSNLASTMGLSGHVTFLDQHAAALYELMLRIRHDNANVVVTCTVDFFAYPASLP